MPSEQQMILEMVQNQRISVDEAERLLNALGQDRNGDQPWGQHFQFGVEDRLRKHRQRQSSHDGNVHFGPRFIHIEINELRYGARRETRRIKVPLKLLKAGISLSGLLPQEVRESIAAKLEREQIEMDPFALRGMDINELASTLHGIDMDLDGTHIRIRVDATEDKSEQPAKTETDQQQGPSKHGGGSD